MSAGTREDSLPPPELSPGTKRLLDILRCHAPELRRRYGVRVVGLFGSYVREEHRPDSDLDVLVEPEDGATLLDLAGTQQDLSDLLGVRVDLAIESSLKPRIGRRILAEVVRL